MSTETNTQTPAQFLAFAGADYYPNGGWSDLLGAFATADEASAACRAKLAEESRWDWWHVVDLQTMAIVGGAERSRPDESPSLDHNGLSRSRVSPGG